MNRPNNWCRLFAGLALAVIQGCSPAEDPQVTQYRSALLLSEEPAGSVTIEDARSNIESTTDVVLTGRIGARDLPNWWIDGSASFYISEGTDGSHYNAGPDHDPSTCPFCRRKWKVEDSMAIIHLVDASGHRVTLNANNLLDVEEGDVVVVRGSAKLDESGFLAVESDGVFVR